MDAKESWGNNKWNTLKIFRFTTLDIDVTYSIDTLKEHYGEFENPWNYFDTINANDKWSNKKLEKELLNLKKWTKNKTPENTTL